MMNFVYSNMLKLLILEPGRSYFVCFLLCLIPLKGFAQTGESVVDALVEMGFVNVGCGENETERIYILENDAYRVNGIGFSKALDVVQKRGLPVNKACRIIVLDNNIPQISFYYHPLVGDSISEINCRDWKISYDLGGTWGKMQKIKRENHSLYKVDFVMYPDFYFRNLRLSRVYDVLFQISPAIEISFWNGMKFSGQVQIPIVNDYGSIYDKVKFGYITLSQTVRLPNRTFLTGVAGFFSNMRWGFDMKAKHFLRDEHFSLQARLGYTGRGYFDGFSYYHGVKWTWTGEIGGNYYWSRYNTQFSLKAERYLLNEYGVRLDMIRHFRYASIGFYAMKVQHAGNNGFNGGFRFQIALPPYKYKRKGYIPRVIPSKNFGVGYNAGNEQVYGQGYKAQASDNYMYDNSFNPYFIKSELLNF